MLGFPEGQKQRFGPYALLSLSLVHPIQVESVSIEHPPSEINDKTKASIRAFRMLCYEGPDATGRRWDLGNFDFKLKW